MFPVIQQEENALALMDKPTAAQGPQRSKPTPVIAAADLEAHREVPSVKARLARVAAIRETSQHSGSSAETR